METEAKTETLADAVARLNLTVESEFVPYSQSRSAVADPKPLDRSLNWRVTLKRDGRDILTTDYTAGIAHAPAYKRHKLGGFNGGRLTVDAAEALKFETERGRAAPMRSSLAGIGGAPIKPDPLDVIHSLASDSDVLEYSSFEQWAPDLGYDPDSRKAESIYRSCLELALKMRNGLGESELAALRSAAADY